ncbi:pyroglutamyl-peptidase I [Luteolibacter marinus]|uniref:pyroglutamyl-peptidase I family protein n=1 Tax=Luteolibacter marinus TaxID=2776705 RepID=UPI0018685416|nr:pyroglutamyl-peptidase I [Luteolibacter marinus]
MPSRGPLLVTAFGPFGGREVNASSLALAALRRADTTLRTRTLPVDLVAAPRILHRAIRELSPRAILLLGEAGNAGRIRLESRAWNELDFTIPDIAGRQPRNTPITPAGPAYLETPVDLAALMDGLRRAGHDAEQSTDPGRYLCNRIFHAALSRARVPALFVHLPLESRLETYRAVAALQVVADHLAA